MKIAICQPSRKMEDMSGHALVLDWARGSKHEVAFFVEPQFGVDEARSVLIKKAREWGADALIWIDMDVVPTVPISDALSFANQAFSRGYGAILSPLPSRQRLILVSAPKDAPPFKTPLDIAHDHLIEIDGGSLGFAIVRGCVLPDLKVLKEKDNMGGDNTPLYCVYSADEGEDYSFLRNVRNSTGFKIGCDGRLKAVHLFLQGVPSWQGPQTKV